MARENIDTEPVPDTLDGIRNYLAGMRADFDSHNHDGANSKRFQTMKAETLTSRTIAMRKTSYADTAAGLWVGLIEATVKLNLGSATSYLKWDGSAISIAGAITASSGTIGGFTIGATTISGGSALVLSSAGAGSITGGVFQTATGTGQRIVIDSTDNTLTFYNASNAAVTQMGGGVNVGTALRITLDANTTDGIKINSSIDGSLGIRLDSSDNVTFNALRIALTNTGSGNDGYCVFLQHKGTAAGSYCLDIDKQGASNAIRVTSTSSSHAVEINVSTNDGASALVLNGNDTSRTVPLLDIDDIATASSGPGIRITSASTVCLDIVGSDANIGAVQIVVSGNSGSNTIGIRMSIANAGAGTEYAFEFAGSEYNNAATGVSGLTGAIKVLTSDGLVYIPVYGTIS